jgi:excisionase family DNA binding protein
MLFGTLGGIQDMVKSPTGTDHIFTRKEIATWFRVHPTTVTRWVKSGELICYRIGGRILFRENDVRAFFEKLLVR